LAQLLEDAKRRAVTRRLRDRPQALHGSGLNGETKCSCRIGQAKPQKQAHLANNAIRGNSLHIYGGIEFWNFPKHQKAPRHNARPSSGF
jgi:hypothetical protein